MRQGFGRLPEVRRRVPEEHRPASCRCRVVHGRRAAAGKDEKSGPTACIVTLKNACDKDSLYKPLQDNPLKKIKIGGKECCQNDAENRLFYFIDEWTFLWGGSDQEAFAACLKALDDDNTKTPQSLALAKFKDCHVFGWCDMSKFDIANKGVDMPFIKILAETQTATLIMHYDGELKTNVSLLFPDEESAKTGARAMMSGVKLLRRRGRHHDEHGRHRQGMAATWPARI